LKSFIYCLKQASRALCDKLRNFLLENGFIRGKVDTTLLQKVYNKDIIIVQIYVDDIIIGANNERLYKDYSKVI